MTRQYYLKCDRCGLQVSRNEDDAFFEDWKHIRHQDLCPACLELFKQLKDKQDNEFYQFMMSLKGGG